MSIRRGPAALRPLLRRAGSLLQRLAVEPSAPPAAARIHPTTWGWTQASRSGSYVEIDGPHSIYRRPPRGAEPELHWKFLGELHRISPPTFVAEVPGGRVVGPTGAVFAPTGHLLSDVSVELGRPSERHSALGVHTSGTPAERFPAVVLTAAGGESYFHWMFDVLPRIDLVRRSGLELSGEERYLVNGLRAPFQRDTLDLLGVPASRLLESESRADLTAERLVLPSLPGMSGNPPAWACEFLRASFLNAGTRVGSRRIYVSRAGAGCRRVVNEAELAPVLERAGFEILQMERLPFATQVETFAQAEIVVAPHGAGLSNLVFCAPGTRVLELFSPNYVNVCYWALSEQVALRYRYLLGEGTPPPEFVDPHHAHEDLLVDARKLERALAATLADAR